MKGECMDMHHPKTPLVFISYSHEDGRLLQELLIHLKPLKDRNLLDCWSDRDIEPGRQWQQEIEQALASAKVAVLLVSPTFLASEFIKNNELPPLLNAAKVKGLTIIWIPISSSNYKFTEIAAYQAALDPNKPLDGLKKSERNKAFVKICELIFKATKKHQTKGRSTKKEAIQTRPQGASRSFKLMAGIAAALTLAVILLAVWQYYFDVPRITSEIRVIFAAEKAEKLPDGSIGPPKSVVITLGVFVANTGKRATGVDKITVQAENGVAYNVHNYYNNFRLDAGDSKKINLSMEINYDKFSTSQPISVDMVLVDGTQIQIDKGVLTEGITTYQTEPTGAAYEPQITITDLWCNDKRMSWARHVVGEKRYNHTSTVDVVESPQPNLSYFVCYYFCPAGENRPQIKAYPTLFE
jgi:hypothetical protein